LSGKARGSGLADLHNGLGIIALNRGDHEAAVKEYSQALELSGPEETPTRQRAAALIGLGLARLGLKDAAGADTVLQQAEATNHKLYQRTTPSLMDVQVARARVALEQGRANDAVPLLAEADKFWNDFNPTTRWAGEAAYWHGRALIAANRVEEGA